MVSRITLCLPFIAKPSLRLLDLTLSKTRFSSHLSFLSRSLRYKVIPNGFKSSFNFDFHSSTSRHIVSRVSKACYEHSRRLMRIVIDSMSQHIQTLDSGISHVKSILSTSCPSILRKDIIQFIRVLNSRLYSFLEASKASKFNSLLSNRPTSTATNHTSSANSTNLVVTIFLPI
jgi:hypothetical protein